MNSLICHGSLAILLALLSVSCSDDPKLVEKREKQKVQLARLRGEISLLDEKIRNLPPDVTGQLAEARQTAAKQAAEVASLEAEVTALEAKKRSLESEFEAYQAKYQVK